MRNSIALRALKPGLAALLALALCSCTALVPTVVPADWMAGSTDDINFLLAATGGGGTMDRDNGPNESILRLDDGRAGLYAEVSGNGSGIVLGLGFERQELFGSPQYSSQNGPVLGPEESGDVTWLVERVGYQLSVPTVLGNLRFSAGPLFEVAAYEDPIYVNAQFQWQVNTFVGVSVPVGPLSLGVEWRTNDNDKLGDGPNTVFWSLRFANFLSS